ADLSLPGAAHLAQIDAVHRHPAARRIEKPEEEVDERALPRAGAADDAHRLSAPDAQLDVGEHRPRPGLVLEADPLEGDLVLEGQGARGGAVVVAAGAFEDLQVLGDA